LFGKISRHNRKPLRSTSLSSSPREDKSKNKRMFSEAIWNNQSTPRKYVPAAAKRAEKIREYRESK
jgi:hypothetical protein